MHFVGQHADVSFYPWVQGRSSAAELLADKFIANAKEPLESLSTAITEAMRTSSPLGMFLQLSTFVCHSPGTRKHAPHGSLMCAVFVVAATLHPPWPSLHCAPRHRRARPANRNCRGAWGRCGNKRRDVGRQHQHDAVHVKTKGSRGCRQRCACRQRTPPRLFCFASCCARVCAPGSCARGCVTRWCHTGRLLRLADPPPSASVCLTLCSGSRDDGYLEEP